MANTKKQPAKPKLYTWDELAKMKGVPVNQLKKYFEDNSRIGEKFSMNLVDPFNWSNPFAGDEDLYMERIPGNDYTYAGNGKVYVGNVKIAPKATSNALQTPTNNFSRSATVNTPTGKATFTSEADLVRQMQKENKPMGGKFDQKGVYTLNPVNISTRKPVTAARVPVAPRLNVNESLVDYLASQNMNNDFAYRTQLAKERGINDYRGTAEQNIALLNSLRNPDDLSDIRPNIEQMDFRMRMEEENPGSMSYSTPNEKVSFTSEEDLVKQMQQEQGQKFAYGGEIGLVMTDEPNPFAENGMAVVSEQNQMPIDVAIARFKAAGKDKGFSGGELAAYVEKMKSKYKYQKGGAVKEEDIDMSMLMEYGSGGTIMYRGHKFSGYNKPMQAPPGDKHKKMVLVKRGDKIRLVKYGLRGMQDYTQHKDEKRRKNYLARSGGIKNKAGQLTKNDPFSANYWARRDLW